MKTSYFITGDGVRIAYRLDGDANKPVLVLSNSIATDYSMWDEQIAAFTAHFRVLRFDTRGNGGSDAPAGDYSLNRMGWDLVELLDYLEIQQVHFLGLSLGGFIAQQLAIQFPDRINKLILANTSGYLGPQNSWNQFITQLRNDGDMQPFAEMFINNWLPKTLIERGDARMARFRSMILATSPTGLAGSYAAIRDADLRNTAALIRHSTLVIAGDFDTVTLPAHSELLAATIRGAILVTMPVVHLANVELPEEFNKQVLNFLLS